MKERKIQIVTILMTLAVCGLIYVQYYWITTAFKIEEEKFERNVKEVMGRVIRSIEINETAEVVYETIENETQGVILLSDTPGDSVHKIMTETQTITRKRLLPDHIDVTYDHWVKDTNAKRKFIYSNGDSLINLEEDATHMLKLTLNKDTVSIERKKIVDDVIDKLVFFSETRHTIDRLDSDQLDSLLHIELDEKGINAEYVFCVTTSKDDSVHYVNEPEHKDELLASSFKARIFPHDFYSGGDYLYMYFPYKDSYILKKMMTMLGLSVVFILIIILVFFKTIQMFIRQKKVTDLKNDLINNVTHEFKTPLATISLACEALNEPALLKDDSSISKYSGMISQENKRLSTLVENLLNTAQFEKNNFELEYEELDVHRMLLLVVENHQMKAESRNGLIDIQLQAESYTIAGDEFHLFNVFNNLIDNANKYTEKEPHIIIKTKSDDKYLVIETIDNGIGIEKQNHQKIFETFYRVPTGNLHDVKGNGIGLSYVKKIVERHNGFVEVESKLNLGSTFRVYLPYEQN